MKKDSSTYIFLYATVMVVIVAGILSVAFSFLNGFYVENQINEKKVFILRTVIRSDIDKLKDDGSLTPAKVDELFNEYVVKSYAINIKGDKLEGENAFEIDLKAEHLLQDETQRRFPVFVVKNQQDEEKIVIPVAGKGLWGAIWGYVSINQDGSTIYGDVFDHASETPGLGADIIEDYFQEMFFQKKIFDGGTLRSIKLVKTGASGDYEVDAISGSTLTCDGVTDMLKNTFGEYEPFLKNKLFLKY